ncbi:MAG TPA: alpha/beta hydrolase fold domain-containing protein [Gordonia sp. (in: high G+C Gram-positive bacteria)]|uniref:alpha/beta hydrolase fold domain-containing protein n=1 Tax=unclassified Gordonia (in: high G+C Gram-positive bacteria) TaxID=2657482 RepID=UPI000F9129BE|nr:MULTISPECIES: alpha/beta hydrolase fold domain-containing protein [unclassified Gordonia (in: high G+C Gram-positive bacteria)]RUP41557.1 MAG: steryl acetyl hydrolase [Gordonia sp. (in: high G+C Gram-positive bacteria)]HNP56646.1 alpha/beta hydrolase fold domain-containing protein [Gordonia sp. (in: high G+C Gram-positive bacteria)]HRC50316.1 alpha/beta hydrolase fold domain-containing protein [Gordonia sp. (in: high G+C Gram-positive bacteria)]
MVMADRPGVKTASAPITAIALAGLASTMVTGLARVPFSKPLSGPFGVLDNVGQATTRQAVRSFLGYAMSLQIDEFRSMEKVIDTICGVVLPPVVGGIGQVVLDTETIGGVEGVWCRAKRDGVVESDDDPDAQPVRATILYLHGGGYIATTPMMYVAFAAALVRITGCEIFIPDYRMAPEFPYPAGLLDAADVYKSMLEQGIPAEHIIIGGDSGGGGLTTSLMGHLRDEGLPRPAAIALFSPEVNLQLDRPSVTENADSDVLPWSIPVTPYLQGMSPGDERVSAVNAVPDETWWPPTFVCWGEKEMFRDGIRTFAEHLEASDVKVKAMEEPGMFHVFPILMPWAEGAKRVFQTLRELAEQYAVPAAD